VNPAIAWLLAAPVRNAPTKPIRIFLLNKRYSFNELIVISIVTALPRIDLETSDAIQRF
jgi:hypothetical protein